MKKLLSLSLSAMLLSAMPIQSALAVENYDIVLADFYNAGYDLDYTDINGTVHESEDPIGRISIEDAKKIHVKEWTFYDDQKHFDFHIGATTKSKQLSIENFDCLLDVEIDDDSVKLINSSDKAGTYDLDLVTFNEKIPYKHWTFSGTASNDIKLTTTDNGVIFANNSGEDSYVRIEKACGTVINGSVIIDKEEYYKTFSFIAKNSVKVTFDENKNPVVYLDPDNDGVFDTPVKKGDVNCDGYVDANDASHVLNAYAYLSVHNSDYMTINKDTADMNGDGFVDASDASEILRIYSELSTK